MNISSSPLKRALLAAAILGLVSLTLPRLATANVTIALDAGFLYGRTAAANPALLNSGSLLLLVASASGTTFGGPTVGNFTSGGDVILGAVGFNSNNGTGGTSSLGGETTNQITVTNYPSSLPTTNYVALYWFPDITLTQYTNKTATPVNGTFYGAYNPIAINLKPSTTLNPDGGSNWTLPPNPSTAYPLDFFTSADRGKELEMNGYAQFTVVPEPSACALLSVMAVGIAMHGWKRRTGAALF